MTSDEEAKEKAKEQAELICLALRITRKLARAGGVLHYEDDLVGIALAGLARALAGHDPEIGPIKPYAAQWIAGEVKGAIEKEVERVAVERPLEEADEGDASHPVLLAEERAHDIVDAMLSAYVGAELRARGEAGLIVRETWAALHREIDRLAPEDLRLVELRYWEELTWDDVAAQLGIAGRTARDRDLRIREELKDALILLDRVRPFRRGP